jgi:SAM-dependent MidA family methyltransferase
MRFFLAGLLAPILLAGGAQAQGVAGRQLVNGWEVYTEARPEPGAEAAIKDYFPSFLEYQDLIMFHPRFGYYGSGRVNFVADYQTFPIVLAPYFGHMIAEHMFKMWQGMRAAGTLGPRERFTVAEFGAGNGLMAESILAYLDQRSKSPSNEGWRDFAQQVLYICYDRSPALSKAQRERNARFGKRFEAREADATDPTATIAPGSLKGVVLSNELPDAFSVHKVILSGDGSAEVAFVAPSLSQRNWERFRKDVPAATAETVAKSDASIKAKIFSATDGQVYLTKAAFTSLLEALAGSDSYEAAAQALQFHEVYVPATAIPELAAHLRRYARLYALELAKDDRGVVTYVNLGVEKFVQGAAQILKAGYVFTLDYGSNWEGIIAQDSHPHLRTYGPAHTEENRNAGPDWEPDAQSNAERDTSDPYRGPSLNDMTTDVNFSLMAAEGKVAGLTTLYFGAQAALRSGTSISLETPPPSREGSDSLIQEFQTWASNFETDGNYKMMVQQKDGTDPKYVFPGTKPEKLDSDEKSLNDAQRRRAEAIEKKLSALR